MAMCKVLKKGLYKVVEVDKRGDLDNRTICDAADAKAADELGLDGIHDNIGRHMCRYALGYTMLMGRKVLVAVGQDQWNDKPTFTGRVKAMVLTPGLQHCGTGMELWYLGEDATEYRKFVYAKAAGRDLTTELIDEIGRQWDARQRVTLCDWYDEMRTKLLDGGM